MGRKKKTKRGHHAGNRRFRNLFKSEGEFDEYFETERIRLKKENKDPDRAGDAKRRTAEFMLIWKNMYGVLPEEHPDYIACHGRTVKLNPHTHYYADALNRMRKMGFFSEVPREMIANMESEFQGLKIFNHRSSKDLTYPALVHISIRMFYWYLLGSNQDTVLTLRHMSDLNGNKIMLKTNRMRVDKGYVLDREGRKHIGLVTETEEKALARGMKEIEAREKAQEELEAEEEPQPFDFDGLDDLF